MNRTEAPYLNTLVLNSLTDPHFLNNLLTSVMALNRQGEQKRLEQALLHLGRLFLYVREERDYVGLGEECRFITHYLELQKLRFGDRLSWMFRTESLEDSTPIRRFLLFRQVALVLEKQVEPRGGPALILIGCQSGESGTVRISVRAESRRGTGQSSGD